MVTEKAVADLSTEKTMEEQSEYEPEPMDEVEPTSSPEEMRREEALAMAIEVYGQREDYSHLSLIEAAKAFEAYLKGE